MPRVSRSEHLSGEGTMSEWQSGRMLLGAALAAALESGRIFRPDTVEPTSRRHSAYDLRAAHDLCIVPMHDGNGVRCHERYPRAAVGPGVINLLPGESAFVSSAERD